MSSIYANDWRCLARRKRRTHIDTQISRGGGLGLGAWPVKGAWSGGFSSVSAEKVSCLHLPIVWNLVGLGGCVGDGNGVFEQERNQDPGKQTLNIACRHCQCLPRLLATASRPRCQTRAFCHCTRKMFDSRGKSE